ncbi:MAG: tetratricopeptide repeat protein [Pseudomonadota bacterium]
MSRRPWMAESDDVQDERYAAEAMDGRERRCSGLGKNHGVCREGHGWPRAVIGQRPALCDHRDSPARESRMSMSEQEQQEHRSKIVFDDIVLDVEAMTMSRDGAEVEVPARSVALISILLDAEERVVDKDDLVARLWPEQDVSDWSLSRLVSDTRQLLGDSVQAQRYIQTVRNRGFRWNPACRVVPHVEVAQSTDQPRSRARRFSIAWFAVILLGSVGLVFAVRPYFYPPETGLVNAVVLPVAVNTGDDRDTWAEYGVMSLLATELQRFDAISVYDVQSTVSGLSQIRFDRAADATVLFSDVCGAFGCSHLIDSRVVIDNSGTTAIDFRIITATDAGDYQRVQGGDILQSASRASREIVTEVVPVQPERLALQSMYGSDRVANQNLALGVSAVLDRRFDNAEQYLKLVLASEPEYHWASLYLADVYAHTTRFDEAAALLDSVATNDIAQLAFIAKVRSNLAHEQGDLEQAIALADEMARLAAEMDDPVGQATAWMNSAATMQSLGRNPEALARYERAESVFREQRNRLRGAQTDFNIGNVHLALGELDQAIKRYRAASVSFRAQGADTFLSYVDYALCAVLKTKGDYEAAWPCFEDVASLSQGLGDTEGYLLATAELAGIALAEGRFDEATSLSKTAYDGAGDYAYARSYASAMLAIAHMTLGNVASAETLVNERMANQWYDPRQPYAFLAAALAHASGDYVGALTIAEQLSTDIADQWTDEHEQWLQIFRQDAASGASSIINYYVLPAVETKP